MDWTRIFFFGIWGVVSALLNMSFLAHDPIFWINWIAGGAITAVLGFILGYGMISKLVLSKNEAAKQKGEQILAKLAPIQGTLGIIGICFGVWTIVYSII